MSNPTKLFQQQPQGPIFSDPLSPDFTVRFKTTVSPKSLNGAGTSNYVTEIIYNDLNPVSVSGVNATDAVSVRIRVSGAVESKARLLAILSEFCTQWNANWKTEDVILGFTPTTVPNDPV